MANVAAAMDRKSLAIKDKELLRQYACETASDYCTGCGHICESAVKGNVPIGDIMRHLMYKRNYTDRDVAGTNDRKLSVDIKKMASLDFTAAEKRCPQKMAIGHLIKEAAGLLS
jgi:hypothetical protein